MNDPMVLICARADADWATRGSSFDRKCGECGAQVIVSPSSQRLLKKRTAMPIICEQCWLALGGLKPGDEVRLPDKPEVVAEEIRGAVPNNWSKRN
ncbi:MAG TPA: hypothetical protein VFV58_39390 [Blastocatellia bacterium]|jgi:hypothetical protein|nr:hypothetical protein [Blastocatellia bacterium]